MTALPAGWKSLSFDEAVEPISDEGKRVDQSDYLTEGKLPVVDQGEQFIGGYTNDSSKAYNGPLPVVIFGDHTRRVKFVDFPFVIGAQGVKLLRPREGWFPKFFAYLLPTRDLPDRGYSRHYQFVRKLQFPQPPEPEQRRIVAEIEKQFTRLEAGVAALRRVQANLHRYRAAVLKAAIPATGTPQVRLEQLAEKGALVLYGILQPGPGVPDGVPYVRPTEIDQDNILLEQIRRTSPAIAAKYKRSVLKAEDIILSIVGTIGKVAIVPASLEGGNITQSSVRIRPDRTQVGEKYLAWVLRSPFAIKQYDAARLGTAVPRLNVAHVRDLLIPVPPLADQERIVAEVERRLSVVEELSALVTANLQRATRLRQSILQQAFEGKLLRPRT